ncbi:MAG: hypothetical protein CME67_02980 [Halobacteriovoraceae bacterium]|nr:hypothetical protein [Peredibacter sp.]MBJ00170.1 hypothetical protein [Halobacteriovoraceae bacterium]
MSITKCVVIFIFLSLNASAQDERFFRKIFTNELNLESPKPAAKVEVSSPLYMVDINRDGIKEGLVTHKKDGQDYFQIKDKYGVLKFSEKLKAKGLDSSIYKVELKTVNSKTDLLLIHFYEGYSGVFDYKATARLYFVVIEDRDLDKVYSYKGPAIFLEREKVGNQYNLRKYHVNVLDYNKDGHNEVSVTYNNIQRLFFYKTKGLWQAL